MASPLARAAAPFPPPPRPGPAPIRVALCLPSALWNQLLAEALAACPDLEAGVGAAAVLSPPRPAAGPAAAGVLLTAVPASRAGWERLAQWCRRGEVARVLVLGENRPPLAARALRLGASGYLDWESPLPLLLKAIRGVAAGELWAERKTALALLREPAAQSKLTRRELHVLGALAEGLRNKEIAALLDISETTVKSHLNRAYRKLQLSDRLQAALYVERHGLEV
ncbi:MAG TPA: response regulator transcription factor [Terriglobales bacterium]|nr:response regulator transcription factor [Terriglobales bacterium]